MTHCRICGAVIDLEGDAQDDYTVHFTHGEVPYYTCGNCLEPDTESTAVVSVHKG